MIDQTSILPRWLTLKEAVEYSPFGQKTLIRMAKDGSVKGGKVSYLKAEKWVFDRKSIDAYILKHMEADKQALAILETMA